MGLTRSWKDGVGGSFCALGGRLCVATALMVVASVLGTAQGQAPGVGLAASARGADSAPARRTLRFLGGRGEWTQPDGTTASDHGIAKALGRARAEHAALLARRNETMQELSRDPAARLKVSARTVKLDKPWQPVGPGSVVTAAYGAVSGRVTAVAIDPADVSGNTVFVGTTGGGVWKSTNAAGPAGAVSFTPLTDTLPVFSASAGTSAVASLSVGALSVSGGVVLAGTGDPNDATDSYYGSGVLRSADGGSTWTLAQATTDGVAGSHSFVGLGFAGFAWSSATPGLVVAAVSDAAEASIVNAGDAASAIRGLYYSPDAGVTWKTAVVTDPSGTVQSPSFHIGGGFAATSVVWNPVRRRFYATLRYRGYYESADGVNWTRVAAQPGAGLAATACLSGLTTCPMFRGALAVEPVTGDMFALTVDGSNNDQGLWQDVCGGDGTACAGAVTFGRRLGGTALEEGNGSAVVPQGDYNLSLAAVRSETDTLLYVGTVDVYRCSLASGCDLRNTTNALNGRGAAKVAPAQHAIAVLGTAGAPMVFVGNDGGLWRSLDGIDERTATVSADDATHFENLNGGLGSLAEVVGFAQDPTDPATLLVGLGGNGTAGTGAAFTNGSGVGAWNQLSAGEGGAVAIDPVNPLNWYVSTGAGVSIKACANGAACTAADFAGAATVGSAQVSGDGSLIDAAWMLDPLVPDGLFVGTCRVWRGPVAGGGSWSSANAISAMFGGTGPACDGASDMVRSLAAGGPTSSAVNAQNAGATVLYAGMAGTLDGGGTLGGHVFATTAGGTASSSTAWEDSVTSSVTNDLANAGRFNPAGFDVSAVAVDPHDATGKTVYAAVMGFTGNGASVPHVYRSVDGGRSWLNVSGNLPNAPANDVAVDPNDANTVYVAMDTGVYVTTQIAECSTTNCWSVYGTGLPDAPAVQLAVAAGMSTGDGRTGELRVGTYGRGIWQIPLLTASSSSAIAGMSASPSALEFAAQPVGTVSAAQAVTITNTGNAPLVVSQVVATGDFHTVDTCVQGPVAVGGTCTVQVSFLPEAVGVRGGVLTVYGNVPGGQATVALSGTAVAGSSIVLNPVTITFSATTVGATSSTQNVTISNTGGSAVALGKVAVTGDFSIAANTCGSSLAAETGCTVGLAFKPAASGVRSGTLTVVDDVGVQTTLLSGTGVSPATDGLAPLSLVFGPQQINTTSSTQKIVLTNAGDVALTLIGAQITAGDFTVVNACGNSLNANSTCSMSVAFVPKSIGTGSGVLTVSDQFRTQTVMLRGMGLAPPGVSLSPFSTVAFGAVAIGNASAARMITLTNNGGVPLRVAGIAVTGDYVVGGGGTCGGVVAVGSSCGISVSFVPTVGGPRDGSLTVTDSAANSPQVLALTGAGVDFTLTANGSTSVTVANGKSAVFPLLLSSAGGVPGTAAFTCTGLPANAACVVSPASAALGGTTTISVTVRTGVVVASAWRKAVGWLAWLLPVGLLVRRRKVLRFVVLGLLMGCGAARKIPGDGSSGGGSGPATPSGSYAVTVSAESAGLVRSVGLTVVVQ